MLTEKMSETIQNQIHHSKKNALNFPQVIILIKIENLKFSGHNCKHEPKQGI